MSAPPEVSWHATEIVDTLVEVVTSAGRPLLWHEVIDEFYRPSRGYNRSLPLHERTLFRHMCTAVKKNLVGAHGLPRARIYTTPHVKLSRGERMVILAKHQGRALVSEDLL